MACSWQLQGLKLRLEKGPTGEGAREVVRHCHIDVGRGRESAYVCDWQGDARQDKVRLDDEKAIGK